MLALEIVPRSVGSKIRGLVQSPLTAVLKAAFPSSSLALRGLRFSECRRGGPEVARPLRCELSGRQGCAPVLGEAAGGVSSRGEMGRNGWGGMGREGRGRLGRCRFSSGNCLHPPFLVQSDPSAAVSVGDLRGRGVGAGGGGRLPLFRRLRRARGAANPR